VETRYHRTTSAKMAGAQDVIYRQTQICMVLRLNRWDVPYSHNWINSVIKHVSFFVISSLTNSEWSRNPCFSTHLGRGPGCLTIVFRLKCIYKTNQMNNFGTLDVRFGPGNCCVKFLARYFTPKILKYWFQWSEFFSNCDIHITSIPKKTGW